MDRHENDRRPPKRPIAPAVALVLAAIAFAANLASRDRLIIAHGIRAYGIARTVFLGILVLAALWLLVSAVKYARAMKNCLAPRIPEPTMTKKSLDEPDRNAMYGELKDFAKGKWSNMAEISVLLKQLDSMDEYQAELDRLLDQSDYLKDKPAEIVQRVEDCMYVNIRKLLNYMRVIQTKSPSAMREKILECAGKNGDLLKKTDDFVIAVVGYVNNDMAPGEEDKTKDYVDSYMFVVLQAIELPEAYLK